MHLLRNWDSVAVTDVLSGILQADSPTKVYEIVSTTLASGLDADVSGVALDTTEGLELIVSTSNVDRTTWHAEYRQLYTFLSGVSNSGQSVVVGDLSFTRSAAQAAASQPRSDRQLRSLVAVPMRRDGPILAQGVLFAGSFARDEYDEEDLAIARELEDLTSTAMSRFAVMDAVLLESRDDGQIDAVEAGLQLGRSILFVVEPDSGEVRACFGHVEEFTAGTAASIPDLDVMLDRLVHDADRERVDRAVDPVMRGRIGSSGCDFRCKRDSESWATLTVGEFDAPHGRSLVGHVVDTTDAKRRERELETRIDHIEETFEIVNHDLCNLLNVAESRLVLARDELESRHVEEARRTIERIDTLMENCVTLALHGNTLDRVERVHLGRLSEQCWETVETGDSTLVVDAEHTIQADRSKLRQVLENAFRNAVEHSDGAVTITVDDLETGFFVEDDGPGIPAEDRESVFESGFSQGGAGKGLGLLIVARVCEAHGWEYAATAGTAGGARIEISCVEIVEDRITT